MKTGAGGGVRENTGRRVGLRGESIGREAGGGRGKGGEGGRESNTIQYNTIVFISQNKPLSGYKRNYSDNALGITVHKRRRLNISSGCFIDVGLCRLYTLTERTRGEHIPHKHKERNK